MQRLFFLFGFTCIISSCTYDFPLRRRLGKPHQKIHVEYSLNPKGFILPSTVFDDSLQKQLIKRFPQLSLSSRRDADLFMRVSYQKLNSKIDGDEQLKEGKITGVNDYRNEAEQPLDPFEIQDLKLSDFIRQLRRLKSLLQ